ncbi:hypothetical protein L6452_06586 [Arctium lappa]|uniref:Uncharacterized protein n=1 Tax=Arctium lappa TaxID=4217 RepID=A0ACB9EK84_ARCLA|nr:hypothetical protein L6452_06586 [Arctium lappa]
MAANIWCLSIDFQRLAFQFQEIVYRLLPAPPGNDAGVCMFFDKPSPKSFLYLLQGLIVVALVTSSLRIKYSFSIDDNCSCRQKTCVVSVNCKNQARAKPCTLKYCHICLLNRYGEKAEDVALLDEWKCPRCREMCNCSICMKKRGHQPTGMLVQMAKADGFSSISDLLHVKGAQNVGSYKRVKETCASPRKLAAPAEGIMITSSKKPGKENLFDGKTDSNANPSLPIPSSEEKPKKMKQKRLDGVNNISGAEINHALSDKNEKKLKPKGLNKTGSSLLFAEKTSHLRDKKKHKKLKANA